MSISRASKQIVEPGRPAEPVSAHLTRLEREAAEAEIAGYISQMTTEMMAMAARARLDLLAYLLSIARTEAETLARRRVSDTPGY